MSTNTKIPMNVRSSYIRYLKKMLAEANKQIDEFNKIRNDPKYSYANTFPIERKAITYRNEAIDKLQHQLHDLSKVQNAKQQFDAIIAERDRLHDMLSQLRYKVEKIYELLEVLLEDDDQIVNITDFKRKLRCANMKRS